MKTIANHRKGSENIAKPMKKQLNHCKNNGMIMKTTAKPLEKQQNHWKPLKEQWKPLRYHWEISEK